MLYAHRNSNLAKCFQLVVVDRGNYFIAFLQLISQIFESLLAYYVCLGKRIPLFCVGNLEYLLDDYLSSENLICLANAIFFFSFVFFLSRFLPLSSFPSSPLLSRYQALFRSSFRWIFRNFPILGKICLCLLGCHERSTSTSTGNMIGILLCLLRCRMGLLLCYH